MDMESNMMRSYSVYSTVPALDTYNSTCRAPSALRCGWKI